MDQQTIMPPDTAVKPGLSTANAQQSSARFFNSPFEQDQSGTEAPSQVVAPAQPTDQLSQTQAGEFSAENQMSAPASTVGQQAEYDAQAEDELAYQEAMQQQMYEQQMLQSRVAPGMYRPIPEQLLVQWVAPSRAFKQRDRQFLVTVLVIALLFGLILLFSQQYVAIAVLLSATFFVYTMSVFPPQNLVHKLTTFGIYVENEFYAWEDLGRFWFTEKYNQVITNIELDRYPGRITLLLGEVELEDMRLILQEVLLEQQPEKTQFEKATEWLQNKIPLDLT